MSSLIYVAVFVASLACSSATPAVSPSTGAGAAGGTFTLRLLGDWTSLDPYAMATTASSQIIGAVYDRLIMLDVGKLVPYIATSWQQTPTSITFKLRTDATCPDGSKITPSLVVDNWKRLLDPNKPSVWASQVVGRGPYSFSADDAAGTATFTVSQPRGDEIYAFARLEFGAIVCPAGLKDPASLAQTPSGSGAFTLVSAAQGNEVRLRARPEWKWGPNGTTSTSPGVPQELVYKVVGNETTAANLLLTGGVDVSIIKGPDVLRLRSEKGLTSQKALPYTSDLLQFNHDPARATSNQVVRQALATAVDPAAWNQLVNLGEGFMSTSVVTPNAPCFDPETSKLVPTPNVDRARAILKSAGYVEDASGKLSKDGKPLTLKILGSTGHGNGPEYLFEQFTKAGVTATIEQIDFSQFQLKYRAGDFDVTVGNFSLPFPGPLQIVTYLSGAIPPAGPNFSRIVDPELETAITAAKASTGDEQCRLWATVQRRLLEQSHVLPLPGQVTSIFARPGFMFSPTANNFLDPLAFRAPPR